MPDLEGRGFTLILINKQFTQKDIKSNADTLAKITHLQEAQFRKNKSISFIDLFSGIGGIRKGFELNSCECVFSSEIDPFAQYTYYTNYGVVPYGDITNINEDDIPEHDILCAGFPCQPFSHIGKREGFSHPTQGTMFHEILRVLQRKKPKAIFLENVSGIINHDQGRALQLILSELKEIGYFCHYTILNAADFGVPQTRKRFYLVGFLQEVDFTFPQPPRIHSDIGDFVECNIMGYSISKHLQKSYLFKINDGRPEIINKNSRGSVKTLVASYHKIQRLTGTFVEGGETGIRLLSENECKSIMGFPKEFVIPVSRTQMYRQMGNSVVVTVIEEIAKEVVHSLQKVNSVPKNALSLRINKKR